MAGLEGKVVALVCRGSDADRAIAVALAEAGANLALGTIAPGQDEEFATASSANEIWAIGREQFNSVLDSADPGASAAFAAEVADRLGRCDAVIVAPAIPDVPSMTFRDEWDVIANEGLTAPLVAAQAFSRVIERGGGGAVVSSSMRHSTVTWPAPYSPKVCARGGEHGHRWAGRRCAPRRRREGAPNRSRCSS